MPEESKRVATKEQRFLPEEIKIDRQERRVLIEILCDHLWAEGYPDPEAQAKAIYRRLMNAEWETTYCTIELGPGRAPLYGSRAVVHFSSSARPEPQPITDAQNEMDEVKEWLKERIAALDGPLVQNGDLVRAKTYAEVLSKIEEPQ